MARRLGQPDIAGNDGAKHLVAEMLLKLRRNLLRQGHARIEHDPQQPDDLEIAVQIGVNFLDGRHQIRQALKREVLALHWDHHAMGGAQGVQGQQRQCWRGIDQYEVVLVVDRRQRVLQASLALLEIDQVDFSAGEFAVGWQEMVAGGLGPDGGLLSIRHSDEDLVDGGFERALVDAAAHGRIALRVEVDQQDALAELGQAGGEVHRRRRLADAALLICDGEDPGHVCKAPSG